MKTIEASGIPIRYVLMDDGHLAHKNRQLTGFIPDKQRFPSGWEKIMSYKKENKIKWIGLWYSLSGYWMGLSPENGFPQVVRQALYPHAGSLLPGTDSTRIRSFYRYYVSTLKEQGFDFLKVDNQALPFSNAARRVMPPSLVNFSALDSRFSAIWRIRNGSPMYTRFNDSLQ